MTKAADSWYNYLNIISTNYFTLFEDPFTMFLHMFITASKFKLSQLTQGFSLPIKVPDLT